MGTSAASSPRSPTSPPPPLPQRKPQLVAPKNELTPKEWTVLKVFRTCDRSGDGCISRRELHEACRLQPAVAAFFGLQQVADEEKHKEQVEKLFENLADGGSSLCWQDFLTYHDRQTLAAEKREDGRGGSPRSPKSGASSPRSEACGDWMIAHEQ